MQRITPCLWFNNNIEDAIGLYTSLFDGSSIGKTARYGKEAADVSGQKEGAVMTMMFTLGGQEFMGLNGGPYYQFTPAISLFVNCATADEVERLWAGLSQDGLVMMPLDKYPFSEKFGWVQDRFGVSWQINLGARKQKINPFLMFVKDKHGKAGEALEFFVSIFDNAKIESVQRFGPGEHEPEGAVKQGIFTLDGYEFRAMESAMDHRFSFTGAISFIVHCDSQEEVDRYWAKLSGSGGKESMCGWLEDQFGISWQIVPRVLEKLMEDPKGGRLAMQALLQMRKLDIKALEAAARAAS
ncbi:MAG: VOC family protein [Candidatus Hydrogenedentes bacterium]|nr:VOC family protein [Candidatus Hydrogenedentota bacterium]